MICKLGAVGLVVDVKCEGFVNVYNKIGIHASVWDGMIVYLVGEDIMGLSKGVVACGIDGVEIVVEASAVSSEVLVIGFNW